MILLTETTGIAACCPELKLLTLTICDVYKAKASGAIFTSRLVLLVEQLKKNQRL